MTDDHPAAVRREVDIRAVAEAAGVATSTASNALNGRGRMSAATRERVRSVAARLEYRPNPTAKFMRAGRSGMIGLRERLPEGTSWRWDDLEFIMRLIRSCCSAAWDRGLYPVMLPAGDDAMDEAHPRLDAVIVIDPLEADQYLRRLDRSGVPYVTMGRDAGRDPSEGWWADNDKGAQARAVLDGLAVAGAKRMMMLSAATGQSYMIDNLAAFRDWCRDSAAPNEVHEIPPSMSHEECYLFVREAVSRFEPDAIYVVVEALVQPVIDAVLSTGRRIPEDVRLVTSSESSVVRHANVPVTTFDLDPEGLGEALVELVTARLSGNSEAPHRIVPVRMIEHVPPRARSEIEAH